jgi:Xaa-Pro aminopeptidase
MDYKMRKLRCSLFLASLLAGVFFLTAESSLAFDRQANSDYHARREALAKKVGGVVVLFAGTENDGPNDLYGFRQDDNFFYLSGSREPGGALLIVSSVDAKGDAPARAYTEVLFLPPRNLIQEKWTGPKLGAENPEAPKITGFDRVEDMGQLPDEVGRLVTGARPVLYTDVASQGESSASSEPLGFLKRFNA